MIKLDPILKLTEEVVKKLNIYPDEIGLRKATSNTEIHEYPASDSVPRIVYSLNKTDKSILTWTVNCTSMDIMVFLIKNLIKSRSNGF